jgi:molecular chaperone HscB
MLDSATPDFFGFLGLTPRFNLDLNALEKNFRAIQSATHPDRFVNATPGEKAQAMQKATLANDAYQTLKRPAERAQYMLKRQGIDAVAETNTAMPMDFLMAQMEWREAIDDAKQAKDIDALEKQLNGLRKESRTLNENLMTAFDAASDIELATTLTRKLIFIDKVCADIHNIIEQIED